MGTKHNAGYCVIDEKGGAVSFKMTVDKDLMTGGQFLITKPGTNEKIDSWRISAEKGESAKHIIRATTEQLHTSTLNWNVLCCVSRVEIRTAFIKFEIFQNGKKCRITEGEDFELNDPAPCVVKNPSDFSGSMTFVVRAEQKKSK